MDKLGNSLKSLKESFSATFSKYCSKRLQLAYKDHLLLDNSLFREFFDDSELLGQLVSYIEIAEKLAYVTRDDIPTTSKIPVLAELYELTDGVTFDDDSFDPFGTLEKVSEDAKKLYDFSFCCFAMALAFCSHNKKYLNI